MAETTPTAAASVIQAFNHDEDISLLLTPEERCCLKTALVMAVIKRRAAAAAANRVQSRSRDSISGDTELEQERQTHTQSQVESKKRNPSSVPRDEANNSDGKIRTLNLKLEQILGRASINRKGMPLLASPGNPSHLRSMMDIAIAMAQNQHSQEQSTPMSDTVSLSMRRQLTGIVCHLAHSLESLLRLQQKHGQEQEQETQQQDEDSQSSTIKSTISGRYNIPGWIRETLVSAAVFAVPQTRTANCPPGIQGEGTASTSSTTDEAKNGKHSDDRQSIPVNRIGAVVTVFRVMLLECGWTDGDASERVAGGEGGGRHSRSKRPRFSTPTMASTLQAETRTSMNLDQMILEVVATMLRDLYHGHEIEVTTGSTSNSSGTFQRGSAIANDLAVHCLLLLEAISMHNPNNLGDLSSYFCSFEAQQQQLDEVQGRRVGFSFRHCQRSQSSNNDGTSTTPTTAMKPNSHQPQQQQGGQRSPTSNTILTPVPICEMANFYHCHYQLRNVSNRRVVRHQYNLCGHRSDSRSSNTDSAEARGEGAGEGASTDVTATVDEGSNASTHNTNGTARTKSTTTTTTTLFLQLDPGAKMLLHLGLYRILQKASSP